MALFSFLMGPGIVANLTEPPQTHTAVPCLEKLGAGRPQRARIPSARILLWAHGLQLPQLKHFPFLLSGRVHTASGEGGQRNLINEFTLHCGEQMGFGEFTPKCSAVSTTLKESGVGSKEQRVSRGRKGGLAVNEIWWDSGGGPRVPGTQRGPAISVHCTCVQSKPKNLLWGCASRSTPTRRHSLFSSEAKARVQRAEGRPAEPERLILASDTSQRPAPSALTISATAFSSWK